MKSSWKQSAFRIQGTPASSEDDKTHYRFLVKRSFICLRVPIMRRPTVRLGLYIRLYIALHNYELILRNAIVSSDFKPFDRPFERSCASLSHGGASFEMSMTITTDHSSVRDIEDI